MIQGTVKIVNPVQVAFYLKHKVKPIDLEVGFENKLIFIFNKQETLEVWEAWKQSCIEYKSQIR